MIVDDGAYYHVDLLRSNTNGEFRKYTDREMGNYVWDYSDYPACIGMEDVQKSEQPPAETEKN